MEFPPGMNNVGKDDCITLGKCFYGLVQAARQKNKKTIQILKKFGFGRGNVDPCHYKKKIMKVKHIDNNLMAGEL